VHAVINRIRLREPIDADVFAAARAELPPAAAQIEGLIAFHVFRGEDALELGVLVVGEHPQALEAMRERIGNAWMREHVVPHAAAPPERFVGEAVVSFERG